MRGRAVAGAVVVLLAAACGGGSNRHVSAGASPLAHLRIRDQAAQHRARAAAQFALAREGDGVAAGDVVRTNGTGFVELDYRDGSLTRLDSNAQLTVTDLSTVHQAQRVAGTLDGGRAWSKVERITSSEGRYEIDAPVATAAVRGTEFDVDCRAADGSCTFTVAEGTVAVTPSGGTTVLLHAGDSLVVHRDRSVDGPTAHTPDELRADPWLAKNLELDAGRQSTSTSTPDGQIVDACSVLTEAEVTTFATSILGDYHLSGSLRHEAAQEDGSPSPDPENDRVCTWHFDETTPDGQPTTGQIRVDIRRIPAGEQPTWCRSGRADSREVSGIGDFAEVGDSGAVAASGGLCFWALYSGTSQNGHAGTDGVAEATLRAMLARAGRR